MVFRAFPNNDIMTDKQAISHLEKETGPNENVVVDSLNELIIDKN